MAAFQAPLPGRFWAPPDTSTSGCDLVPHVAFGQVQARTPREISNSHVDCLDSRCIDLGSCSIGITIVVCYLEGHGVRAVAFGREGRCLAGGIVVQAIPVQVPLEG